jgi:hypothetical protein
VTIAWSAVGLQPLDPWEDPDAVATLVQDVQQPEHRLVRPSQTTSRFTSSTDLTTSNQWCALRSSTRGRRCRRSRCRPFAWRCESRRPVPPLDELDLGETAAARARPGWVGCLVLDVDQGAFDVDITPELDRAEVSNQTLEALELRRALAELSDRAHRQTPAAVAELRRTGLTVRDVARLLGVTPLRASQIEKECKRC